jgi:hypothetical protein
VRFLAPLPFVLCQLPNPLAVSPGNTRSTFPLGVTTDCPPFSKYPLTKSNNSPSGISLRLPERYSKLEIAATTISASSYHGFPPQPALSISPEHASNLVRAPPSDKPPKISPPAAILTPILRAKTLQVNL